jgi:hypothetical protein
MNRNGSPCTVETSTVEKDRDVPSDWNGPPERYFRDGSTTSTISKVTATCKIGKTSASSHGTEEASVKRALAKLTTTCACKAAWHFEEPPRRRVNK